MYIKHTVCTAYRVVFRDSVMNAAKLSISRMLKGVKSVLQLSLDDAETFIILAMFIYGIRAMIIMPVHVNRGFSFVM